MKKIVFGLCFSVMMVFMFSSCNDEKNDSYVSYGVIRNMVSKSSYEILTDKGNTLMVNKSQSSYEIEDGKRVMVNFKILSDKSKSRKEYTVEVIGFYNLLSKPLVRESYVLQNEMARRDSIGNDPFINIYAWFGGDYININFGTYYVENSAKKHLINLVYDDTKSSTDTLYLTLYQNAYGEVPGYSGTHLRTATGRCSFKLSDILPEGVSEKPVKLIWKEYRTGRDAVERFDTGVFKKGNYGSTFEELNTGNGFDDSLTVK